jgi:outer membrane lipoprotein-sorting protein
VNASLSLVARAAVGAILFVLVGGGLNFAAQAPVVPPARILQMALEAPRLVDYEGTEVITALRAGRMETITVAESHKRPDLLRLEYVSPGDLAGRLIVDKIGRAHV